jgi:hypothetical protein
MDHDMQRPNYFWRLYVVCPKGSLFYIIKTNPYEHTYVHKIIRSDHAQLTVKMMEVQKRFNGRHELYD